MIRFLQNSKGTSLLEVVLYAGLSVFILSVGTSLSTQISWQKAAVQMKQDLAEKRRYLSLNVDCERTKSQWKLEGGNCDGNYIKLVSSAWTGVGTAGLLVSNDTSNLSTLNSQLPGQRLQLRASCLKCDNSIISANYSFCAASSATYVILIEYARQDNVGATYIRDPRTKALMDFSDITPTGVKRRNLFPSLPFHCSLN